MVITLKVAGERFVIQFFSKKIKMQSQIFWLAPRTLRDYGIANISEATVRTRLQQRSLKDSCCERCFD